MNIITGYLSSNQGTVLIDGIDVLLNPKEAKNTSAIFRRSLRSILI